MKLLTLVFLCVLTSNSMAQSDMKQVATLGNGCFWCSEAIFERVEGISNVRPGFSGGTVSNPSYKEVCTGQTGHAEVIQLEYDPETISFAEILEIYFKTHDPTQLNRQGNDVGTQYRSVIFYHTEEQKKIAYEIKEKLTEELIWDKPIVTEIVPFSNFYPAEDYHDNYYKNNPNQGYCRYVITPKVEKFEKVFKNYIKD